jgi:hypothetical protein
MPLVGGDLSFRVFGFGYNLVAKTTPFHVLGLMIQLNTHLKIHDGMSH